MPRARDHDERAAVFDLIAAGATHAQASARTGVPIHTIRTWLQRHARPVAARCEACRQPPHDFAAIDSATYAYLLGSYLGDGHVYRTRSCCGSRSTSLNPGSSRRSRRRWQLCGGGRSGSCRARRQAVRERPLLLDQLAVRAPAAGARRRCARDVPARAHPHRRLARHEPGAREGQGLRVSRATSSPTARTTFASSSRTPVTSSGSSGGSGRAGTSPSPSGSRWRGWTSSWGRSGDLGGGLQGSRTPRARSKRLLSLSQGGPSPEETTHRPLSENAVRQGPAGHGPAGGLHEPLRAGCAAGAGRRAAARRAGRSRSPRSARTWRRAGPSAACAAPR